MQGVNTISQWEMKSSGCEQSMRLLDFFGKLALQEFDRAYTNVECQDANQNLLLLNTLITGTIRDNLRGIGGTYNSTNYPFATRLMNEIGKICKAEGLSEKESDREVFR